MPKNPDLQKHTLNLRKGDFAFICDIFSHKGIDGSVIIRSLVAKYVDNMKKELEDEEDV